MAIPLPEYFDVSYQLVRTSEAGTYTKDVNTVRYRPVYSSPPGTSIPPETVILDRDGNRWTLLGVIPYRGAVAVGTDAAGGLKFLDDGRIIATASNGRKYAYAGGTDWDDVTGELGAAERDSATTPLLE